MARGQKQYTRLAKPMGMIDLEDNEFYNFLKLKRKGGIFQRLKECVAKTKQAKFTDKDAKKQFMKDCMAKSGKVDKKAQLEKKKKAIEKIKLANKKRKEQLNKPQGRIADPSLGLGDAPKDVGVPPSNEVNEGGVNTTQPETKIEAKPNKKLFLYGAIGVIVLVFALKIIKN